MTITIPKKKVAGAEPVKPPLAAVPTEPAKPSLEQVLAVADDLTKDSAPDEINNVLRKAVKAGLSPVARDKVITRVRDRTGLGAGPLKAEIRLIAQEQDGYGRDNAMRLAKRVLDVSFKGGTHLLRCADGMYWVYNEKYWQPTTDGFICSLLMTEALKSQPSCANMQQLVGSAKKTLDYMRASDDDLMGFSNDPLPVVNCLNGEVWLGKDGKPDLRPHNPKGRLTSCLPIAYDPESTCQTFDKALHEIFGKATDPADMTRHFIEFIGYAIQPRRDVACFWLLIGHGANGKSKLLETIQRLVGPAAVMNAQIAKFQNDRFNVAALLGKLLFVDDDMGADTHLDDGLLKAISEAKEMSARHAYGERHFKLRCLALPVMAGNHYPTTSDNSHGLRRRAMVVPFDRRFGPDEANKELFPKIWEAEMPGVLNRALEGLARLRQRGAFLPPQDCERAAREFLAHANPLNAFPGGRDSDRPNRPHFPARLSGRDEEMGERPGPEEAGPVQGAQAAA